MIEGEGAGFDKLPMRPPDLRYIRSVFGSAETRLFLGNFNNANPYRQSLWLSGLASELPDAAESISDDLEHLDDAHRITVQKKRIGELQQWTEVDGPADPVTDRANMRLLRDLLDRHNPERIDQSVKAGESMISLALNGIKTLNDQVIGFENTKKLLAYSQAITAQVLRNNNLIGLLALPDQTAYKFLCLKTDINPIQLPGQLEKVKAEIRTQIDAFVDQFGGINNDQKQNAKDSLVVTLGYATALENHPNSFDLLKRSLLNTQAHDTLEKVSSLVGVVDAVATQSDNGDRGHVAEETANEQVTPAKKHTDSLDPRTIIATFFRDHEHTLRAINTMPGEQKAVLVAQLGDHLRQKLIELLRETEAVSRIAVRQGDQEKTFEGMSEKFFTAIRKKDMTALEKIAHGKSPEELEAIKTLGGVYLDCLATPAMLRYHVSGEENTVIERGSAVRRAIQALESQYQNGTVPTKEQKRQCIELARSDRRFALDTPTFTAPWVFENVVTSMDKGYHLIGMDLVGVGAGIASASQRMHLQAKRDDYESLYYNTRTLGEDAWRRIRDTFYKTADFMKTTLPDYKAWCDDQFNGLMPVEIRGDEMFLVLPDDKTIPGFPLKENQIEALTLDLDDALHKDEKAAEARIAFVTGDQGQEASEAVRIQEFLGLMRELSVDAPAVAKSILSRLKERIGLFIRVFSNLSKGAEGGVSEKNMQMITRRSTTPDISSHQVNPANPVEMDATLRQLFPDLFFE